MTLARRCGDNAHASDDDAASQMDEIEGHGAEAVKISLDGAHEILQLKEEKEEEDAAGSEAGKVGSKKARGSKRKLGHWPQKPNAGDGLWDSSGNRETNATDEYKKAARSSERKSENKARSSTLFARVYTHARS